MPLPSSLFLKMKPYLLTQSYDVTALTEILRKAFGKGFLIPKQMSIQGNIESAVSGRIDGNVRGDVNTLGTLIIGKNGHISGNIYATDLVSYGKIFGDVFVSNKALINNTAYVKGDVTALVLKVEEEAVIEGAIRKNMSDPEAVIPEDPHVEEVEEIPPVEDKEEEQNTTWF